MDHDDRIYSRFSRLSLLAKMGQNLSWRPPYSKMSPLSGLQKSHQRGRGLDFVELRHYFAGDDVRCIDWRVTQRIGKPFIRLYAEEKDKNTALLIDLRSTMFFASDGAMKSVLASELAAIIAGRIQIEGDRIGGLILTDTGTVIHDAKRGDKSLLQLLEKIELCGQKLPSETDDARPHINDMLEQLCKQKIKDSQVFIISDFVDFDMSTTQVFLSQLAKHNDVIGLRVSDPLEEELPETALLMGNGDVQLEINDKQSSLRERYNRVTTTHHQQISTCFASISQPCLRFTTHQDCWQQLLTMSSTGGR